MSCRFSFIDGLPLQPPETPALYCEKAGGWIGYGDLAARVAAQKAVFARPDRRLAFISFSSSAADVVGFLGCLAAGHAAALIDPKLSPDLLERLVDLYQPDFLIGAGRSPGEGWRALPQEGVAVYEREEEGASPLSRPHPDLALLLPTSGSTGTPKMARISAAALNHNCEAIIEALKITREDRALAHLPLHYSYGLSVLTTHLAAGAGIVLTDRSMMEEEFWTLAQSQSCASLAGTPFHFRMIDRLGLDALDVPSIKVMTQAGGRLGADLIEKFHGAMERRGGRFYVMYGQTEASPRITTLPHEEAPGNWSSAGRALKDGKILILDQNHGVLPAGQDGEVVYVGPNVMMGYAHQRSDLERDDEQGGVLHTGDLGHLDADDRLFLTGRANRFAKVAGLRLNLDELEKMAEGKGRIAAIEGQDGIVLFAEGISEEEGARLRDLLAEKTRIFFGYFHIKTVKAIPSTSQGKVDYKALKIMAQNSG